MKSSYKSTQMFKQVLQAQKCSLGTLCSKTDLLCAVVYPEDE